MSIKHMILNIICILILFCYHSYADSLSGESNPDSISKCSSDTEQQSETFHKRIHIQYLLGAGSFDFPNFNTDYAINGHKPGYRPGLTLGTFSRIVLHKAFFLDPGLRLIYTSGSYSQLNTEGQITPEIDDLTWTKVMLNFGLGTGFQTSTFVVSIRAGIVGDFSVTTQKDFIGNDIFYSFGIGGDVSAQFEIKVTPYIGIPIRIGYGSSVSSPLARFVAIWDTHWYDYITHENKTQKYDGPYLMSGVICYVGKKVF